MNKDLFLQHIEKSRDCEQNLLDMAVKRGICRARDDRFDSKKLLKIAAACILAFTFCITVSLEPFKAAADGYYKSWNEAMPGCSEILAGYVNDLAGTIRELFENFSF